MLAQELDYRLAFVMRNLRNGPSNPLRETLASNKSFSTLYEVRFVVKGLCVLRRSDDDGIQALKSFNSHLLSKVEGFQGLKRERK